MNGLPSYIMEVLSSHLFSTFVKAAALAHLIDEKSMSL